MQVFHGRHIKIPICCVFLLPSMLLLRFKGIHVNINIFGEKQTDLPVSDVCICVFVYCMCGVYLYVCECVYMYICIYVNTRLCVCVSVCVHVVYIHVHIFM